MSAASKSLSAVAAVALVGVAVLAYNGARPGSQAMGAQAAGAAPVQTADGTPINACALLSQEEVAAAVGAAVTKGDRRDAGDVGGKGGYAPAGTYSSTCIWQFQLDTHFENDPNLPMGGKRFAILNAMVWPKSSLCLSIFNSVAQSMMPPSPSVVLIPTRMALLAAAWSFN